ncbi:GNAT family N-acetyltransferase [Microvirga pudoricolor]|uniref:GNAT family N-acetyltransferase n=1 Tax=Microvirga pudoricolor TaxID=2778729 RepID=UPI0019529C2E|nr:GNAT family N-acetyltransferase [Microvirga pudoricolor]MBM6593362.1 GNAT family N-acetyltransferase [Microvirga pudoricolor]
MNAPLKTSRLTLVPPNAEWLDGYEHALAQGWSPNTTHDISRDQLAMLRRDRANFFHEAYHSPNFRLPDGTFVPRLPARDFLIVDGEFCGRIGLRFQTGTVELPPYVSGHIGYTIVPWKQGRGYATEALRRILPVAREVGLARVMITCDDDNIGSIKVIRANGGIPAGDKDHETRPDRRKLLFWVPTPEA